MATHIAGFVFDLRQKHPHVKNWRVELLDSDGCLVINVYDAGDHDSEVLGHYDTGLNGDDEIKSRVKREIAEIKRGLSRND